MIGGKVEIRKDYDNMLVMIRREDGRMMKLNGISTHTHNVSYLSNHGEGMTSSSILWHLVFGHIDYGSPRLLRKNGVSGVPTILEK
jgi:hypothetical protein